MAYYNGRDGLGCVVGYSREVGTANKFESCASTIISQTTTKGTKKMKTVSTKLYIVKASGGQILLSTSDMSEYGWLTMGTETVTVDVPQDFDEEKAIEEMKLAKRKKLDEEYQRALSNV